MPQLRVRAVAVAPPHLVLQTSWEKATEAEVAVLVGLVREARNPQRLRKPNGSSPGRPGQ